MDKKQYFTPPRLNNKFLMGGLTVLEFAILFSISGLMLYFIILSSFQSSYLVLFPFLFYILKSRYMDNNRNLAQYIYKRYIYAKTPSHYSLKEDMKNENV